jgi:hypothetical protein
VDHFGAAAPNAAHAAEANANVNTMNTTAAATIRFAAAAAFAAESLKCTPIPGTLSVNLKHRTNTKTTATDSKIAAVSADK